MPKIIELTHPTTGETKTLQDWSKSLGMSANGLRYRLQVHAKDLAKVLSPRPLDKHPPSKWRRDEDDLLISVYLKPDPYGAYARKARANGWITRSESAIEKRIVSLRKKGKLPIKRGDTSLAMEAGYLHVSGLADLLEISDKTVTSFFSTGLRWTKSTTGIVIPLNAFAKWATTDIGSVAIARALKNNERAIRTLMQLIGKYLWIG